MFSCTCFRPLANSITFFAMRRKSFPLAVGLRLPIELTQRIRLCLASLVITCFLLSGSPSQSLAKQIISSPCNIFLPHAHVFTSACRNLQIAYPHRFNTLLFTGTRSFKGVYLSHDIN